MNSHDGKAESAHRWAVEFRSNQGTLIKGCFADVQLPPVNTLLRTVGKITNDRGLLFRFMDVEQNSPLRTALESLRFKTGYEIVQHRYEGPVLAETWNLAAVMVERTLLGQPDGLFTINIEVSYNQLANSAPQPPN